MPVIESKRTLDRVRVGDMVVRRDGTTVLVENVLVVDPDGPIFINEIGYEPDGRCAHRWDIINVIHG